MDMFNQVTLAELQKLLLAGNSLNKVLGPNLSFKNIKYDIFDVNGSKEVVSSGELVIRTDEYKDFISKFGLAAVKLEEDICFAIQKAIILAYKKAKEEVIKEIAAFSFDKQGAKWQIGKKDNDKSTINIPETEKTEFSLIVGGIGKKTDTYIEIIATLENGQKVLLFTDEEPIYKWLIKLRAGTKIIVEGEKGNFKVGEKEAIRAKKLIRSLPQGVAI